ncbi:MAG: sulfatase-like hydrolase/transferase [Dyadobacter sp.]
MLKKAGYVTGAFGKWGLGMVGTSDNAAKKGFDQFFRYDCQRQSYRYYPAHLWDNDKKVILYGNDLKHKAVYAPKLIQQKTLAFIDKHKPFFLFVPTVLLFPFAKN